VIRLWGGDGTLLLDGEQEWHASFLAGADWDATGERFAVVSDDHRLSVHQLHDRTFTMTAADVGLTCVAWDDVTGDIAVGCADGSVLVYRCEVDIEPESRQPLHIHDRPGRDVSWSPDGKLLCVAADYHGSGHRARP
jgi:WD40 repeat protein